MYRSGDLDAALRTAVDASFNAPRCRRLCSPRTTRCSCWHRALQAQRLGGDELVRPLADVCRTLARQIAADAEGASRVVRLKVRGAADARDGSGRRQGDRRLCPRAGVVLRRRPQLGSHPRCRRSGADTDRPGISSVAYDGVVGGRSGAATGADLDALAARLASGDFTVDIVVGDGPGGADVLTDRPDPRLRPVQRGAQLMATGHSDLRRQPSRGSHARWERRRSSPRRCRSSSGSAGTTVVIKYGGSAMVDESLRNTFADDVAMLHYVGHQAGDRARWRSAHLQGDGPARHRAAVDRRAAYHRSRRPSGWSRRRWQARSIPTSCGW